jgi:putative oxidoreductase
MVHLTAQDKRFTLGRLCATTDNMTFSHNLIGIGRILLALYFLVPGIAKFLAFDTHVTLMTTHKVPFATSLLVIAGIAQVLGALLLLTNRFVRFSALGFVVYTLVINVMMHDFWNFSGLVGTHELQNFIKNLGIVAGLLVLAGHSPWRMPSLQGLTRAD